MPSNGDVEEKLDCRWSFLQRETGKLWKVSVNRRPFQCLGRGEIQEKLRSEKRDLAEERRRCRGYR